MANKTYPAIEGNLARNIRLTKRFGGDIHVATKGPRTAPTLVVRHGDDWFTVVLGKTLRVKNAGGKCSEMFPKKTTTEEAVVKALNYFFKEVSAC